MYKLRDKEKRNQKLYRFWLAHQDWTYEALGAVFHISKQLAWSIIKKQKEVKTNGKIIDR